MIEALAQAGACKPLDSQETHALLTARSFLVEKVTATETFLRAAPRIFVLKMGSKHERDNLNGFGGAVP
jgi:hypothetical protein